MTNEELNQLANQVFTAWLEANPQSKRGEYLSQNTNILLAFDAYMNAASWRDVQDYVPQLTTDDFVALKKYISDGIEHYLLENAKTLAISNF